MEFCNSFMIFLPRATSNHYLPRQMANSTLSNSDQRMAARKKPLHGNGLRVDKRDSLLAYQFAFKRFAHATQLKHPGFRVLVVGGRLLFLIAHVFLVWRRPDVSADFIYLGGDFAQLGHAGIG